VRQASLLSRVLSERRRLIVPLAIAVAANLAAYALAVYPLHLKVGASEARARAAQVELQGAEREHRTIKDTVARTGQADSDLKTFYRDVLPRDLTGARRLTHARLADLADEHDVAIVRRNYAVDATYRGRLRRLQITMSLEGEYPKIRALVHALEAAPEFLVIEDVTLLEGVAPNEPLTVTIQLSTYYGGEPDGA
jgi:hypothetical protein